MRTLDYQPNPPPRARRVGSREAIAAVVLVPLVLIVAGWLVGRPRPSPPPSPPTYYQPGELLALEDFQSWSILKSPTAPGPFALVQGQMQQQSSAGYPLSGRMGTPKGPVPFDLPAIPDTSLLVVAVVNPAGQHDMFVLCRLEKQPAVTSPPATNR